MKLTAKIEERHRAKNYWIAIVALGALVATWSVAHLFAFAPHEWAPFLALTCVVIISGSRPIRIPGTTDAVTASDAFILLGLIFLGVPAAVMLGIVDSLAGAMRSSRRATSRLGAPAMVAVSLFITGHVFYLALALHLQTPPYPVGTTPLDFAQLLVPLILIAILQHALNCGLVAMMRALKSRRSIWDCWREGYVWTAGAYVAAALVAALIYQAILGFGLLYVLLAATILGATYASYKIFFARFAEKAREAEEMGRLHLATVEALATAIDAKDQTTHCHVRRVQIYAAGMGKVMGLPRSEFEALKAGALLHDIGKLAVPDHILNKPGKLTEAEFERMKIHTSVGAELLERVEFPYPVAQVVRHHHERWDGKGYPDGLQAEEIPLAARILAVVDCYDSAREDRPYRLGMTHEEASALLERNAGTSFDPQLVQVFLRHLPRFEADIAAAGLHHGFIGLAPATSATAIMPDSQDSPAARSNCAAPPSYLEQIKNAHREVYTLYEIARTFGASLEIKDTVSILVNKVGHVVPFETCVVYLYDEARGYARAAHVAGQHAAAVSERCVALGEGVVGFALANRRVAHQFDPMLDFAGAALPPDVCYRSMVALPLVKDERLLGALAVYSLEANRYTDDHIRLLDMVARLASDALSNAMQHAEAESNALTDTLTGLPNRRSLRTRFEQEAARARRTGQTFQVVMLDLDDFKQVNDTFGHKIGDQVLREAARILQAQLREYDFLARYAGDEFVAIVLDLSAEQTEELRARIEQAFARFSLRARRDQHARVGISVGTASFGTRGETLDQLLIAADQAMYADKSARKSRKRAAAEVAAPTPPESLPDIATGELASVAVN